MITISTGGIGHMDIMTNSKPKGASKEEEKAGDAFASLMNMVSTRQDMSQGVNQTEEMDVSEVAPAKDSGRDYEAYKTQEKSDVAKDLEVKDTNSSVKESTQTGETSEVDSNQEAEQQIDEATAVIDEIKTIIKDALNINDEELESLLADMGIQLTDLAIGDNLKNLLLQAQGATNVDMIVNEDLANLVNEVVDKVNDVVSQYGFDNLKDFEQFVMANKEEIEVVLQDIDVNTDISISDDAKIFSGEAVSDTEESADTVTAEDDYETTHNKSVGNNGESELGEEGLTKKIVADTTTETTRQQAGHHNSDSTHSQIANTFNQAIDNAVVNNGNVDVTAFAGNVQEADIIRQIIDQIKVNAGREVQSMEVQLNPENLGKVYVNVEAKDGVMQAKIIAETEAAKNAIENNLAVLKENFSNQELKVEAIEVMVATYDFFREDTNEEFEGQEQANDTSKSVGGINVNSIGEEELTEEEELEVEIMKAKGNTVSYTV
ncbi:MAG: flagellar hook-length control protein FliK [Lachnospiraceae bacterium]|nr:flagellar hook-length control protein FliK [Lachnospiraceae bacterium]MBQ8317340.1 flagellar hook-length control protein FliK [Lachnospiraceae bacterium]